jgi:hypothetical protein
MDTNKVQQTFTKYLQILIIDTLDVMAHTGIELVMSETTGSGMGERL